MKNSSKKRRFGKISILVNSAPETRNSSFASILLVRIRRSAMRRSALFCKPLIVSEQSGKKRSVIVLKLISNGSLVFLMLILKLSSKHFRLSERNRTRKSKIKLLSVKILLKKRSSNLKWLS